MLEDPPSEALLRDLHSSVWYSLFTAMRTLAGPGKTVSAITRELDELRLPAADGKTMLRFGDARDGTALRFTARSLQGLDPEVFDPILAGHWLDGHDLDNTYRQVMCAVLLLRGDDARGGMLTRAAAEHAAGLMADCTLIDVAGVGHLVHWLATETTTRLLLGFLESLR